MPFFEGSEGYVYYRSWLAPGTRATVVFLHGFGEHTGPSSLRIVDELEIGFPDHFGHTLSERLPIEGIEKKFLSPSIGI
jgi:hypothetical protein